MPGSSTTNQAQIELTGTTVEGADITITAGANNTNYYDDLGVFEADASQYINATLSPGAEPGDRARSPGSRPRS